MADSDITVAGLALSSGIGHNLATWTFTDPHVRELEYLSLAAVELWAASSNNRALASKIDEGRDKGAHLALSQGQTFYYWIRARNKRGFYGDWYPSSATGGVVGTTQADPSSWVSFTPSIAPLSGAFSGGNLNSASYKVVGKTVSWRARFVGVVQGTASGALELTLTGLPSPATNEELSPAFGYALFSGGLKNIIGQLEVSSFHIAYSLYDGTDPYAAGIISYGFRGEYEAA